MPSKIILYTGAPLISDVDAASCTLNHFDKTFCNFMGISADYNMPQTDSPTHATWRSLPLVKQPFHTDFSQAHQFGDYVADNICDIFRTSNVSIEHQTSTFAEADILTQFCEESLAFHDDMPSSQLDHLDDTVNSATGTSFITTSSTGEQNSMPPPPMPSHLSDLEDVPPARHILALNPQTVTVNLIVGIMSIAQPRTVTTRWGSELSLIEVLVGDETKSGLIVTFWVPCNSVAQSEVGKLRRQDVVLMRNVGLHVFRGKVYGQSLRKGLTQLSLLWRRDGGAYYSTKDLNNRHLTNHPQKEKTRQVKDWVLKFVGGHISPNTAPRTRKSHRSWDEPPDDTQ